jgi:N-acyl-D-aspartate/D-glutamate deacylase
VITTVLEGPTIIDGSGRPRFSTDIAFAEERIALIGDCTGREARRRFDCRGKIAAPGFIDACSHTGEKWLTAFTAPSKTSQGIVAEITRFSGDSSKKTWEESLPVREVLDLARRANHETSGTFLVDHDVQAAVEAGAAGLWLDLKDVSTGEAVAKATLAASLGARLVSVTLADYGEHVVASVDDAISLAERASVHVHIANHHAALARASGRMERTLERIDRARTRGAPVSCDIAPYTATWIQLSSFLPQGVTPESLCDEALATAVSIEVQAHFGDVWDTLMLAEVSSEERMAWCGMRFDEIARQTWKTPARAVVDFIAVEPDARAFFFCLNEDDVAMALSADFCAVGTAAGTYRVDDDPF